MGLALQVTISFGYRHNLGSLNKGLMICSCKNLIVHEQQSVMQLVIEYFEQQSGRALWGKEWDDKSRFRFGGAQILVGKPRVEVELLDRLFCSSVVIAPHLSRRGPNGLWILSRAANHPLEQAFHSRKLYYLRDQGCPNVIVEIDGWRTAYSLELFRSREFAEERAIEEKDAFGADLDVSAATGSDLLGLIAAVDVIDIYDIGISRFPISIDGTIFCGEAQLASADALLAAIGI